MLLMFGLVVGDGFRGLAEGPVPCASTATGDIEIVPLKSTVFSNERNLRIWLPPGYHDAANASKAYPVLCRSHNPGRNTAHHRCRDRQRWSAT